MDRFEMARQEMIGDQIDEHRREPSCRRRKTGDARLDVVLYRAECIDAPVQPDSGLNVARQLRRNRAFDEVAEEPAYDELRVFWNARSGNRQRAVRQKIHAPPVDGTAM